MSYDEAFALFYDALTENVDYEARCTYLCDLLAEHGAGKGILLDMACGTGTLSALLAGRGYDVIGVDASSAMLSVAQEKRMEAGFEALFLCQRLEELDLFGTIDAAVCTLDSLNHITDPAALREVLRRTALFMNDGGVFIFDVNTPYKHAEVLGNNTFVYELDDLFCVWQNTWDAETQKTQIKLDLFIRDEEEDKVYERYEESFCERVWEIEDLKQWLEDVRFEVVAVYAENSRAAVSPQTERAVFVCKKHGTQFQ